MNRKLREIMQKFFGLLHKSEVSCMAIIGKDGEGCVSLVGSKQEICGALKNCFDAVQKGEANEGQEAIADIVLDVVSLAFSPKQMGQIMSKRVDKLLPKF